MNSVVNDENIVNAFVGSGFERVKITFVILKNPSLVTKNQINI